MVKAKSRKPTQPQGPLRRSGRIDANKRKTAGAEKNPDDVDFTHLLKSWEPPSAHDRRLLTDISDKLVHEITEKEALIRAIRLDIDQRTHKLHECASILTGLRLLPPEILLEIFSHCLPYNVAWHHATHKHSEPMFNSFDPKSPLNVITQVCTRWRDIAVGSSQLWTQLAVHFDDSWCRNPMTVARLDGLVKRHLYRAGKRASLSVSLMDTCSSFRHNPPSGGLRTLIHTLMRTANRWSSLFIHIPNQNRNTFFPTGTADFARLETLILSPRVMWLMAGDDVIFQTTPRLKHFAGQIRSCINVPKPDPRIISYTELVSGELVSHMGPLILDRILYFPNLEMLEVYGSSHKGENRPHSVSPPAPIEFPHVKSLMIRGYGDLREFLSLFIFPKLESLTISDHASLAFLRVNLTDSKSELKEVTFNCIDSDGRKRTDMYYFLKAQPSIRRLVFNDVGLGTSRYILPQLYDSEQHLLPNLKLLDLRGDSEFERDTLRELRESRPELRVIDRFSEAYGEGEDAEMSGISA